MLQLTRPQLDYIFEDMIMGLLAPVKSSLDAWVYELKKNYFTSKQVLK